MQQAHDRSEEHIRDVESYLVLRRETIGAKLAFALLDCDEGVLNDPRIMELENAAIDIISLSNVSGTIDFHWSASYNLEEMIFLCFHYLTGCLFIRY